MQIEFIKELDALLTKYNASIDWGCAQCSDTHGIYDERMTVTNGKGETLLYLDGGTISSYELKQLKD
jgi:sulfur relay (sulfurtransferase) complex TusBCD TusD component (DsrE family)